MRLTEKNQIVIGGYQPKMSSNGMESQAAILFKLGQLEDIEEELGIDLVTLFKALKNGIYTTVWKKYAFGDELTIDFYQKCFSFKEYECSAKAYFKDYAKTWALTKGELL